MSKPDKFIEKLTVDGKQKISLKQFDTDFTADYDKDEAESVLDTAKKELSEIQEKLYAANQYAVLILFQAMDAGGKDSAIEHVMSGLNPQGCQVYSFKQPSVEEYDHDFLWRHYKALPEKGRIGIHNRSHYENVLICRVHPEIVLKERLHDYTDVDKVDKKFWEQRYESIRDFEKHLARNGTIIIKFFLHVSKKEQKERFLERIDDPAKNWKFSSFDVQERSYWNDYMNAYEDAINATATEHAPWYIVPADKKWFTRIAISQVITERLKALDIQMPQLSASETEALAESKRLLEGEG
ncbi:polyphosphate kinase 2 family protein [Pedobacter sp. BS3]|uniref:polyphosphate kinase 2 family protein n=1 Tax=Pedobacter sp. BS3 TaxID=2567937 RepID=UPI0011ED7CA4|nr:polyphosphate kinase 2 family protein [Pedobacter sp. BS3]TZF83625.1 polyphosphate kinase 2 family protein [Pedobacter sp. BS3]